MAKRDLTPRTDLAQDVVRSLLDYDPETGIFRWKMRPGSDHATMTFNAQWAGKIAGSPNSGGYTSICINYRLWQAHRLAWLHVYGELPKTYVDHINRIRTDNRIANLRVADGSQNQANSSVPKTNSSGEKGVRFRNNRWIAQIGKNRTYLGSFRTREEAVSARREAAKTLWGDFAD